MTYPEAADHARISVENGFPERPADHGEVRVNHAVTGDPELPAGPTPPPARSAW